MGTEMVDLYVGPEKQHFRVHEDLLCIKIKPFDAMLDEHFEDGQEGAAHYPEDSPKVFALLIKWLYPSRLPSLDFFGLSVPNICGTDNILKHEKSRIIEELHVRSNLMILAKRYEITDLLKPTMTQIWEGWRKIETQPSIDHICHVYDNTTRGSLLRTCMAASCYYQAYELEMPDLEKYTDSALTQRDLIRDIFVLLSSADAAKNSSSLQRWT